MKRLGHFRLLACLLAGLCASSGLVSSAAQLRIKPSVNEGAWALPLEQRLLSEGARGQFQTFSLVEAALIASGAESAEELREARDRVEAILKKVEPQLADATGQEKAEAIFEALHEQLLTGKYQPACTSLRATFSRGDYNCVSSTILFCQLARSCGLQVESVTLPDHVYCRVQTDTESFEVQTTCPTWFQRNPGPMKNTGTQRTLGDVGLVALVYYNQGVERLVADDFEVALSATEKAVQLDPQSNAARANLRAAYNNWAVDLATKGRYEQALALLAEAREVAPDHIPFQTNELAIYQQWTASHVAKGHLRTALKVLDQAIIAMPGEAGLVSARRRLYRRILAAEGAPAVQFPTTSSGTTVNTRVKRKRDAR